MIGDYEKLLGTLESGTREEIWEAAKDLESLVLDISLVLLRRLRDSAKTDTRAAAAYVLGFGHFASARIPLEEVLDNANEDSFVGTLQRLWHILAIGNPRKCCSSRWKTLILV